MTDKAPQDLSISVIVPVGPSSLGLREQLHALAPQLTGNRNRELILSVNDELVLHSKELGGFSEFLLNSNVNFSILSCIEKVGPSFARNAAWKEAKGDLLLFCDSDDLVEKDWVEQLSAGLSSFELVGGSLSYVRLNSKAIRKWQPDRSLGLSTKFGFLPYVATCNMGVRSEVMRELNGFDETFATGEDIDFCWRVQFAGHHLGFIREAQVNYRLRSTFRGSFWQAYHYAIGDVALRAKYLRKIPKSLSSNLGWICIYSLASAIASMFQLNDHRKFASKIGYFLGLATGLLIKRQPSR